MLKKCRSLFSPAVGSKARVSKYPIDDYGYYDAVVEPFAHAGPIAIERLLNFGTSIGCRRAFVGDSDYSIYSIWRTWLSESYRRECDYIIGYYSGKIKRFSKIATKENLTENDFYGSLCQEFNNRHLANIPDAAAVSLLLRKLTFGGVIRCNKEGNLNVGLSYDKLMAFPNWKHTWHELDPMCEVNVSGHWEQCLDQLEDSGITNALVLIDPPYWLPRKKDNIMTQAYSVHQPYDHDTYNMAVNSVDRALSLGCTRVVHTNYWSRPMQQAMECAALKHGVTVYTTLLGTMTAMNKSQKVKTDRIETAWEFGGKRMFWPGGFNAVKQMEMSVA